MMKLVWVAILAAVLLATTAATATNAQEQEVTPSLLESSVVSSSDASIVYDGANSFVEVDDHAADELTQEQDDQEPMMLELEAEEEADVALIEEAAEGETETEQEADQEVATEQEAEADQTTEQEAEQESDDSALIEKAKKSGKGKASKGKKGKASKGKKSKKGSKKASKPKTPKAKKARKPKAPASDATAIVQTGRGKSGRNCRGSRCRGRKHGWGIAPEARRRVQQRLPSPRLTGAASTLTRANVRCVLCQFISQKLKNELTAPEAGSASLIEAFSFASLGEQSRIESHVSAEAFADARMSAIPTMFDNGADAPRRFRHTDVLAHRAARARFTQVRSGSPSAETEETRAAYLKLYSTVYASFESLCAKRMPLAYLPYCNDMLKSYRFFAQGINYADRPDQICMNGNFCDPRSYVRRVTHNAYQREPGDA